jgi:hypothetical protein
MCQKLAFILLTLSILTRLTDEACNTHPGDRKQGCIPREIPCAIENCLFCQNKQCMECTQGFYMDFQAGTCNKCMEGCRACFDATLSGCYQVHPEFMLDRQDGLWVFARCPEGSTGCSLRIPELKTLYPDGCLDGNKQVRNDEGIVECKKCAVANCQFCDKDHELCDKCFGGFKLTNGNCVDQKSQCKSYDHRDLCTDCPENKRFSETLDKCVYCPVGCSRCRDNGKCSACSEGYRHNPETMTCSPCRVSGCRNCEDSEDFCVQCVPGTFFDYLRRKCMPCPKNCATCKGPNKSDCIDCSMNMRLQRITYGSFDENLRTRMYATFKAKFPGALAHTNFLAFNFHPDREVRCLDKCLEHKDLKGRLISETISIDRRDCHHLEILHPLQRGKQSSSEFVIDIATDEAGLKMMKEKRKRERERYKRRHGSILGKEAQERGEHLTENVESRLDDDL